MRSADSILFAFLASAASLVALLAPQQGAAPTPTAAAPRSFGEDATWDDGKAELSIYDAEEIVEGERRNFEATSIVVAEHFDAAQMVKKEQYAPGCVPLLKCNWFLSIPTGVYRYQQMASLFLRRSDLLVMKAAFSSQEWCGMTFAEWRRDRPGLVTHSYWDGEADVSHELGLLAENVLFYEQLPLWVRGREPQRPRTEPITLIQKRLGTSKCPPPKKVAAAIWFDGAKTEGGAERLIVRLLVDKHEDTFLLAPEFPHVLQEWRRADGTVWKLRKTTRLDYWKYSKNDFAGFLGSR